jgi:tetratricopeptide (TPR) repeat protein
VVKIATCILSGGERAEGLILQGAGTVESFTDCFLLVNTGPTAIPAIHKMASRYPTRHQVIDTDQHPYALCSQGRNQCLREAYYRGFDWACLLDSDMGLDVRGEDVREFLNQTKADVVSGWFVGRQFTRPLFFRLPANGRWYEDPHEYYHPRPSPPALLPKARWCETGRDPAGWKARAEWLIDSFPGSDARSLWWRATALLEAGRGRESVSTYLECAQLDPPASLNVPDLQAWCLYRAAKVLYGLRDWQECIRVCRLGVRTAPNYPEFWWLEACAEYRFGRYRASQWLCSKAILLGVVQRLDPSARLTWSDPIAWYDGPWDLTYWLALEFGDDVAGAIRNRDLMMAERLATC